LAAADDAAVYKIDDQRAIISTTDFFPPVVDNPYDFGAIAAANAMSDVYAMGGEVLFALNLLAFPEDLPKEILREIMRGGAEKVAEAGGVIAGGHSVSDKEPKYGLAVTGMVHPDRVLTKGGGQIGDALYLTKSLGAGLITTALKRNIATDNDVDEAVRSMKRLNKKAARAAQKANSHAVTDVTGFGLLGHAHEMAHLGNVGFRFFVDQLPWLPGAVDYARADCFPGGTWRNQEYFEQWVTFGNNVSTMTQYMLWTPETSGGLLVAVAPDMETIFKKSYPVAIRIGEVIGGDGNIEIV
jgi:selenide,water dikinase